MGLSNEERLLKFFHRLMWWRQALAKLRDACEKSGRYDGDDSPRRIVGRWVKTLDSMVGDMVTKLDASGAYWLIGENDGNYKGLITDPDLMHLATPIPDDDEDGEVKYGSLNHWLHHLTLEDCAKRWTAGKYECGEHVDRDCVLRLALWWTQWREVDAVLYPVDRYHDKLFRPINDTLRRMLGEMVNRRYEVVLYGGMPDSATEVMKVEQALLSRFHVVMNLLTEAERKLREECRITETIKNHREARRRQLKFDKRFNEDEFDAQKVIERVGDMTLVQVAKYLKDEARDKYEWKLKYNAAEAAKKTPKQPDGILGAPPRPQRELERIVQESKDADEIERATEELEEVYRCFWGLGADRIEKEGLRTKKPAQPNSKRDKKVNSRSK